MIKTSVKGIKAKSIKSPILKGHTDATNRIADDMQNSLSRAGDLNFDTPTSKRKQFDIVSPPPNLSDFISRTESLLERVKGAVINSTPVAVNKTNLDFMATAPSDIDIDYASKLLHPNHDITDIELLLQGVPEAYEDEPSIDDEMVEHLLKLGGPPPSQVKLPTFHALNQKIMSKLERVQKLRIDILNLSVFSPRYGVRYKGSYLILRLPTTYPEHNQNRCPQTMTEDSKSKWPYPVVRPDSSDIFIPLVELNNRAEKSHLFKNKKESLSVFFSGDLAIKKSLSFELRVSDKLLQDWLQNKNGLVVELYGFLAPPGTKLRGLLMEPVCFARSTINLQGLFTTPNLDAFINCALEVDKVNMVNVMHRMEQILFGQRLAPLGTRLGILSMRLALVDPSDDVADDRETSKREIFQSKDKFIDKSNAIEEKINEAVDNAFSYVPEEFTVENEQKREIREAPARVIHKTSYVGIAIFSVKGLNIASILSKSGWKRGQKVSVELIVAYKLSMSVRDEIIVVLDQEQLLNSASFVDISLGRIADVLDFNVIVPVLEFWLQWKYASQEYKQLLGFAYTKEQELNREISLPFYESVTYEESGFANICMHVGFEISSVESQLQKSLDHYAERRAKELSYISEEKNERENSDVRSLPLSPADDVREQHTNMSAFIRQSVESNVSVDSLVDLKRRSFANDENFQNRRDIPAPSSEESGCLQPRRHIYSEEVKDSVQLVVPNDDESLAIVDQDFKESETTDDVVHLLDIALYGTCPLVNPDSDISSLGTFVCYSLPMLSDSQGSAGTRRVHFSASGKTEMNSMFTLWWDSDCPILNGSNRHRFSGRDDDAVSASLGINKNVGIEFFVVISDCDGNIIEGSSPLARGKLDLQRLQSFIRSGKSEQLLQIQLVDENLEFIDSEMTVRLSYRSEPVILRASVNSLTDGTQVSDARKTNAEMKVSEEPELQQSTTVIEHKHDADQSGAEEGEVDDNDDDCEDEIEIRIQKLSHLKVIDQNQSDLLFTLTVQAEYIDPNLQEILSIGELGKTSQIIKCDDCLRLKLSQWKRQTSRSSRDSFAGTSLVFSVYERFSLFQSSASASALGGHRNSKDDRSSSLSIRATDKLIGTSIVDLSWLSRGLRVIEGWYHIIDGIQAIVGQVLLSVCTVEREREEASASVSASSLVDESFGSPKRRPRGGRTTERRWTDSEEEEETPPPLLDFGDYDYEFLQKAMTELERTKERLLSLGLPAGTAIDRKDVARDSLPERNSCEIFAVAAEPEPGPETSKNSLTQEITRENDDNSVSKAILSSAVLPIRNDDPAPSSSDADLPLSPPSTHSTHSASSEESVDYFAEAFEASSYSSDFESYNSHSIHAMQGFYSPQHGNHHFTAALDASQDMLAQEAVEERSEHSGYNRAKGHGIDGDVDEVSLASPRSLASEVSFDWECVRREQSIASESSEAPLFAENSLTVDYEDLRDPQMMESVAESGRERLDRAEQEAETERIELSTAMRPKREDSEVCSVNSDYDSIEIPRSTSVREEEEDSQPSQSFQSRNSGQFAFSSSSSSSSAAVDAAVAVPIPSSATSQQLDSDSHLGAKEVDDDDDLPALEAIGAAVRTESLLPVSECDLSALLSSSREKTEDEKQRSATPTQVISHRRDIEEVDSKCSGHIMDASAAALPVSSPSSSNAHHTDISECAVQATVDMHSVPVQTGSPISDKSQGQIHALIDEPPLQLLNPSFEVTSFNYQCSGQAPPREPQSRPQVQSHAQTDSERLQESLLALQQKLLSKNQTSASFNQFGDSLNHNKRGKFLGRHKVFIDDETERISKIMMGVLRSPQS